MAEEGAQAAGSRGLRLLSWNVHDLLGDPLAVARVLRAARPDVACLQEAPRWPASRWRLAALARAAGLLYVVGGREAAGTAMLCSARAVVTTAEAFRLPVARRRSRPRGAVVATVGLPGEGAMNIAGIHLGLQPPERARHVRLLAERLAGSGGAVVVAGDFNETPGGPSWAALAPLAEDPAPDAPATYPARRPRYRIDAVLTGPDVEVLEYGAWQPDDRDAWLASDHRPVLAVLRRRPSTTSSSRDAEVRRSSGGHRP